MDVLRSHERSIGGSGVAGAHRHVGAARNFHQDEGVLGGEVEWHVAPDGRDADDIELGRAEELFRGPYVEAWIPFGRFFDMTADGQRFFMAKNAESGRSLERVTVMLNWLDELESRFEE